MHARARMARGIELEAERLADGRAHVVGERHLGPGADVLAEDGEALVRVDAAAARAARSAPRPSNGSPEACASRWRTVEPGGPAGSSRSTTPSSAATSVASALTGFETEASSTARRVSPWVAIVPSARGHAGRREGDVPAVDLAQSLHGGAILPRRWSAA